MYFRIQELKEMEWVQITSKVAIWIAMFFWCVAIGFRWLGMGVRGLKIAGLGSYTIHVVTAFASFYEWSWRVAISETARLTEAVTGFSSGIGLWVNFAFLGYLVADLKWNFRALTDWIIIFMIANGAVVFASGPVRWYGIVLLLGLVAVGGYAKFRNRKNS